ncbi:MAG: DUF6065 family protein [Candidatus Dormibacteraceae bacterium]
MAAGAGAPILRGYRLPEAPTPSIVPASWSRAWMDATVHRWPYRCLPMVIANQCGWIILNDQAFFVTWAGGDAPDSVKFVYPRGRLEPSLAESHFGYGILTFKIPFVFRTSPGYNLLVRGPANWPKDGISALEGVVETDWAVQTFTMNWKFTRPNVTVPFSVGEPICMIVPQRRGELESFCPELRDVGSEPELARGYQQFAQSRSDALAQHPWGEQLAAHGGTYWQKKYFRGRYPDDSPAPEHQSRLNVRPFVNPTGAQ